MKLFIVLLILVTACSSLPPTRESRKLIEWGWDTPRLQQMAAVLPNAQSLPFDGVVVDIESPLDSRGLSWTLFGNQNVDSAVLAALAEEYADLPWGRFTDNFLRLNVHPANVDWFDDNWAVIERNGEQWARLAHELGFVGIMFDVELYSEARPFDYAQQQDADRITFEDYAAQTYLRGRAFMDALEAGYPALTVMFTYALTVDLSSANPRRYELLIPFVEGMLASANASTTLIDGYEHSYIYREEAQFKHARDQILMVTPQYGELNQFDSPIRAAFGLWIDPVCGTGGLPPEGCGFTPSEFQTALDHSLDYTDRYVWIYSQNINWYTNQNIPSEWWDVMNTFR